MFHLELTDIHKSQKIDTMGIWKILYSVTQKSFKVVLFNVKWYRLRLNQRDPDRTIIEHDNGFSMVNTKLFDLGIVTSPTLRPAKRTLLHAKTFGHLAP